MQRYIPAGLNELYYTFAVVLDTLKPHPQTLLLMSMSIKYTYTKLKIERNLWKYE